MLSFLSPDHIAAARQIAHTLVLVVAGLAMLAAALSDVRCLIISNRICLFLAGLFPLYVLTASHDILWTQHLLIASAVLAIGFGMFAMNLLGGGDVKMLAAASLWAGPKMIATLLVFTSVAGGLLALGYMMAALYRSRKTFATAKVQAAPWYKTPIPYGVAIASGGVMSLFLMA